MTAKEVHKEVDNTFYPVLWGRQTCLCSLLPVAILTETHDGSEGSGSVCMFAIGDAGSKPDLVPISLLGLEMTFESEENMAGVKGNVSDGG